MRKILTILGTLALFGNLAIAQEKEVITPNKDVITQQQDKEEDPWILLGKHRNSEFLLQKDSLRIFNFDIGPALRMTMQSNTPEGIIYNNLFFWVQSCKQRQGELVYFSLDQKKSQPAMVVIGGKDIGGKAVTIMCKEYDYHMNHLAELTEQEKKESSEWKDIAVTDKLITSYKRGTNEITLDKDNKDIKNIQIQGRVIDLSTKKVSLQNWFTSLDDCHDETGILHIKDLSNNAYTFNKYSFHSGSMASLIAEDLCKNIEGAKDKTK